MNNYSGKRTLFMILGSDAPENQMDLQMQEKTWLKALLPNQKHLILRGSMEESAQLEDETLFLPVVENYENILKKTVLGLQWALENTDFEILIRTNVSTYFPVKLVDKEVERINPLLHFFGGYIDDCWMSGNADKQKISFVTGTAIIMTRPTVELLCKSDLEGVIGLPDDVAISIALSNSRISAQRFKRNDLGSSHIFYPRFQIRVKTSSASHLASKRMKNVHEYFQSTNLTDKCFCYVKIVFNEIRYATVNVSEFLAFFKFSLHRLKKSITSKSSENHLND